MTNDQHRNQQGQLGNQMLQQPAGTSTPLSVYDREDATYVYPSLASTAHYCVDFWSAVKIPDSVYTQFGQEHHLYRVATLNTPEMHDHVRGIATEVYDEWAAAEIQEPVDEDVIAAKWSEIVAEIQASVVSPAMDPRDTPVIARAALMYHNAPGEQFEVERDAVMKCAVQLVGGMTTVAEVAETYRTEDIYWAVSTEPQKHSIDQGILIDAIHDLKQSVDTIAGISSLTEIADQQRALLTAVESSIKLQQPVAKLAQKQLDDRIRDYQDNLRARSLANIEAAAQRREARGEKR